MGKKIIGVQILGQLVRTRREAHSIIARLRNDEVATHYYRLVERLDLPAGQKTEPRAPQ